MRAKFLLALAVLALLTGAAQVTLAQVAHNAWTTGAPLPVGVWFPGAVGVVDGEIWVAGGDTSAFGSTPVAFTQVFNPDKNTWRIGVPLPTPLEGGCGAVVGNVFYVIGGSTTSSTSTYTTATWA
jgi:hypothetical protein